MIVQIACHKRFVIALTVVIAVVRTNAILAADPPAKISDECVQFKIDEAKAEMQVLVDGKETLTYKYGPDLEMPYFYPVHSPSGKPLTVERTEPYPHHRSLWFADTVQPEGERKVSFYDAYYTGGDRKNPQPPYKDHIRHVGFFSNDMSVANSGDIGMKLVWEMDGNKPVIDEARRLRVAALGQGEYLLDMHFTVTPSSKPVTFISDSVHYAWPYLRISKEFSVDGGGTRVSSTGNTPIASTGAKKQQKAPAMRALWVDYFNTVGGETEGLAMFAFPQERKPPLWLARDYGTFGPRRVDAQSGRPFTLKKGEQLEQHVGVLIHRGDAKDGKVAQRYQEFVKGKL